MSRNSREEILKRIRMGLHHLAIVRETEKKMSPSNFHLMHTAHQIIPLPSIDKETQQKVIKLRERLKKKKWILIEQFIDEIVKVSGKVMVAKNDDEIREFIIKLLEEHSATSLSIWESEGILQLNLREFLENRGLEFTSLKSKEEMAKADIGITEADFAIADTGTIVLIANEKQPRSVSLIPPIHIALMRSNIIVENMEDVLFLVKNSLAKSGSITELTSCMTFITGPSRTADIELNLTLGVHGPREIFVLIYP